MKVRRAIELAKELPQAGFDNLLPAAIKLEARPRILLFDLP
jgi:hypothetical protein